MEEVNKEEQTTIETLFDYLKKLKQEVKMPFGVLNGLRGGLKGLTTNQKSISIGAKGYGEKKVIKSTQGMPWLSEAMKDVISCDKLRVLANMN